ncbi:hypothetical protein [Kibdelosporangium philippinense]|uniref:hypothetical protein n=1 Tax=Kibdelosporangium philippinense TaxID=211113 RepID=UPI00360CA407
MGNALVPPRQCVTASSVDCFDHRVRRLQLGQLGPLKSGSGEQSVEFGQSALPAGQHREHVHVHQRTDSRVGGLAERISSLPRNRSPTWSRLSCTPSSRSAWKC